MTENTTDDSKDLKDKSKLVLQEKTEICTHSKEEESNCSIYPSFMRFLRIILKHLLK